MAEASYEIQEGRLLCQGSWISRCLGRIENQIDTLLALDGQVKQIDASQITELDSAGALILLSLAKKIQPEGQIKIEGLKKNQENLFHLIQEKEEKIEAPSAIATIRDPFYVIGRWSYDKYLQTLYFLAFIGEVAANFLTLLRDPKKIQWRSTLNSVDVTGYQALPIVALMAFLIGVVLAYQLADQLKVYGADIFIVDVTGIALLREFGPLITAIIVAGRTSTSFAALIGTMKVNEEIDAMKTMGLSPIQRLVLPRLFGILIALPLLVVWADIFGILGSMVMSKNMLNIPFNTFIERFEFAVELKQYVLGLIKAPFFAMIIAGVGCFQGLQVEMSAESVGAKTTKAAVQAIFLIIVADAGFSVLFNELGY